MGPWICISMRKSLFPFILSNWMILAVSLSFDTGNLIAGKLYLNLYSMNEAGPFFFYLFIDYLHFSYKLSHQISCPFCLKVFGLFCCFCYCLLDLLTLVYPMYYKYFLFLALDFVWGLFWHQKKIENSIGLNLANNSEVV